MRYAILAPLVLLAGCLSATGDVKMLNFAAFAVNTADAGNGMVTAAPSAFFFKADDRTQLPTSQGNQNGCVVQLIGTDPNFSFTFADPGESVGFAAGTEQGTMQRQGTTPQYAAVDPITFAAGGNITFTVPGAPGGFPAATITGKTAEPLTVAPIVMEVDRSAGGVPVTWSPAGNADSKIVLTLKYAAPGSSTLDEQVLCVFNDDGSDLIPSTVATQLLSSSQQEGSAQRVRTTTTRQDEVVLHISSVYEVTVQMKPAAAAAAAQ